LLEKERSIRSSHFATIGLTPSARGFISTQPIPRAKCVAQVKGSSSDQLRCLRLPAKVVDGAGATAAGGRQRWRRPDGARHRLGTPRGKPLGLDGRSCRTKRSRRSSRRDDPAARGVRERLLSSLTRLQLNSLWLRLRLAFRLAKSLDLRFEARRYVFIFFD
jgi:hypothetical protein